jgi:hypothetical protein
MLAIMASSFDSKASKITTIKDGTVACLFINWNSYARIETKVLSGMKEIYRFL